MCEGFWRLEVVPSPKSQVHVWAVPAVNSVKLASRKVWEKLKAETGAPQAITEEQFWLLPQLLVTVRHTLYTPVAA